MAATIVLVLTELRVFQPYEQIAYRSAFQLRGTRPWSSDVVVIAIDDYSLNELGQFPLPRRHYAELLTRLRQARPRVTVFNLFFSEPAEDDPVLAEAIAAAGNVVLAEAQTINGEPLGLSLVLQDAAVETGHIQIDLQQNQDGLVRSVQMQVHGRFALGWVAVERFRQNAPETNSEISLGQRINGQIDTGINEGANPQLLWINWPGFSDGLATYSFSDVLADRVDLQVFQDKIVLVGVNATGIDPLRTPFDVQTPASSLVLHAAVIDNALGDRFLVKVHGSWAWAIAFAISLGLSWGLSRLRSRRQLIVTAGLGLGWGAVYYGFFWANYWLPLAVPLALIAGTGSASVFYRTLRSNRLLQTHVHRLWQTYRRDLVLPDGRDPEASQLNDLNPISPVIDRMTVLAEAFARSQSTQAAIARNLSVGLLAADQQGQIWFCNPVAQDYLNIELGDDLSHSLIPNWLPLKQWEQAWQVLAIADNFSPPEIRQGDRWYQLTFERLVYPLVSDKAALPQAGSTGQGVILLVKDITDRKQVEIQLQTMNQTLEVQVRQRTAELEATNADLQREIVSRQAAQDQLTYRAFHDELTGLPNRSQFLRQLHSSLAQAQADPYHRFAVLFLDFNRFKLINDSFGHLVGDQLLKAFANRLQGALRPRDTIARFGGDEFMLLLREVESEETAIAVANRVQEILVDPFKIGTQPIVVSTSIGIVVGDRTYQHAEELLRDADTAMYQAKRRGLPFEVFEGGMHLAVRNSLNLEMELRLALEQQQLEVYYQPIIALDSFIPIGFEALVRWQHPERGLITPAQFIPMAEETGLILPLGQWVLRQACQQLQTWQESQRLSARTLISVNLSAKQFAQSDLLNQIEAVLAATRLAATCLKLEVTESVIINDVNSAIATLQQLRDRQIQLSLDDFGTGYSSLSYLQRMPVNVLKIHRSFVERLHHSQRASGIVETIIALAKHLNMQVIAEGIENGTELDQLRHLGCDYGQGFLFARPLSASQAERWLINQSAVSPRELAAANDSDNL